MSRTFGIRGVLVFMVVIMAARVANAVGAPGSLPADLGQRLVNDHCPVTTDEFASPQHEINFRGSAVRFCCDECKGKFLADPAAYVARLPQLAPATVQAVLEQSQRDARAAKAEHWVNRWTQPVLLGAAALIGAWLLVRTLLHRRRLSGAGIPGDAPSSE